MNHRTHFLIYLIHSGRLSEWPYAATCGACGGPRPNPASLFCLDCQDEMGISSTDLYEAEDIPLYRKLTDLARHDVEYLSQPSRAKAGGGFRPRPTPPRFAEVKP